MTIRVPKWLLWALAAVAVAAALGVAFLLGRSSGDGKAPASAATSRGKADDAPAAKEAVCSKPMAESATLDTEFDDRIRREAATRAALESSQPSAIPFFTDDPVDYQVGILECADLTGDGIGEMVVGLAAGAAGRVFQWAIFTPDGQGRWTLAFDRELSRASSIEIAGDAVLVETPIYGRDDPLCCPSGSKVTKFGLRGGEFGVISPTASAAERLIVIGRERVARIGRLEPLAAVPQTAKAAFGRPTGIGNYPDTLCKLGWEDIGLSISFANFGLGDPCGPDGRIASVEIVGLAAAQAGWETDRGATVGTTVAELERLYPNARRSGEELALVEVPSPFGEEGRAPIATAYLEDGAATAYRFYIGAAGE